MANIEEDINPTEAQRIMAAEIARISANPDLLEGDHVEEDDPELQGDPLSYGEVVKLVPPHVVKDMLFNTTGQRTIRGLKASRIQHVGLARVILQRFIEIERTMPNNMEFALYFVQMVYTEKILHRRVNWNALPSNAGTGKGRPADKKRAREAGRESTRTRPPVMTPTHAEEVAKLQEDMSALSIERDSWRQRALDAEWKLERYADKFGELSSHELSEFTFSELARGGSSVGGGDDGGDGGAGGNGNTMSEGSVR